MSLLKFLVPVAVFAAAFIGGRFTSSSLESWYKTLKFPSFVPPGSVIGIVWTVLFILLAIAMLLYLQKAPDDSRRTLVLLVFFSNLILNVGWSYLFFYQHLVGLAVFEAGILALSVVLLILFVWPVSALAACLLIPYAAWVSFATFLTYSIWVLNK